MFYLIVPISLKLPDYLNPASQIDCKRQIPHPVWEAYNLTLTPIKIDLSLFKYNHTSSFKRPTFLKICAGYASGKCSSIEQ